MGLSKINFPKSDILEWEVLEAVSFERLQVLRKELLNDTDQHIAQKLTHTTKVVIFRALTVINKEILKRANKARVQQINIFGEE